MGDISLEIWLIFDMAFSSAHAPFKQGDIVQSHQAYPDIDLRKYWLVLRRRWVPAAIALGSISAIAAWLALSQKPVYQTEGKLLIESSRASSLTGLGEGLGQLTPLVSQGSPLDTQAEIIRSAPILEEVIQTLDLRGDDDELLEPEDLAKRLTIRGVRGTDVLVITYKGDNPRQVVLVVNTLIDRYIKANIQSNRSEAVSARDFIAQQLPKTEAAVKQADAEVRRFRENNRVINLEEESKAAVALIAQLEEQMSETRSQLSDAMARSQDLQARVGLDSRQAAIVADLSQLPAVQEVLVELQKAQQELQVERTRYLPGYPSIVNLERKITSLNSLLQQRVQQAGGSADSRVQIGNLQQEMIGKLVAAESDRMGLTQRLTTLAQNQAVYRQRASAFPRLDEQQRELERRLTAAQTTYETLLSRLQEVEVAENQNVGNARVVAQARYPQRPVRSRSYLLLLGGGTAGVLLAIATAFLADLVDRSIKTVKQARETFGYTLLGIIPALSKSALQPGRLDDSTPQVLGFDAPNSPAIDSYQMLQGNLKFLSSDREPKRVVVTSSVAKEGKSEVIANLAMAMAQAGRRILLIDADLRSPSQHHIWNLLNIEGLSNVIVEQIPVERVIQSVAPNLDVLPAGVIPPNPLVLLDSMRMEALVTALAQKYDSILFDAPPLAGTADVAALGQLADGILFVVRPGVVDAASAESAKEFLAQSGQNVLGMVINGVNTKIEPDSYFYYSRDPVEAPIALPAVIQRTVPTR
jgi:polysaccharide biosynthesis transport protein